MHSQKGRIPRKLLHTAVIICVAALCLASIEMASAKYIFQSHGNDSASVARFSPALNTENNIDISGIKKPGDSTTKTFEVRNYSGDSGVSEVTIKYTISLKTTGNLPLRFTLLDVYGNSLNVVWECNGTNGQQEYKYESLTTVFSPGTLQSHTYQLKAEWPNTQKDSKFSGMTDAVYVSVKWEQVD